MRVDKYSVEVVTQIPTIIEDGILCVSFLYNVSVHNCPCGCSERVIIPINPKGWSIQYNGEELSFYPSIGNWSFACRSHYFITNNKVKWMIGYDKRRVCESKKRRIKSNFKKLLRRK